MPVELMQLSYPFQVCGKTGHRAGFVGATYVDCPNKPCYLCKQRGHTTATCPFRLAPGEHLSCISTSYLNAPSCFMFHLFAFFIFMVWIAVQATGPRDGCCPFRLAPGEHLNFKFIPLHSILTRLRYSLNMGEIQERCSH